MDLNKWLKRKYPEASDWIVKNYETRQIQYLKENRCSIGVLKEDNGENKKGDYVIYHHTKEMIPENENGYEYPNDGGWSGSFIYYYYFAKPSNMIHNSCYLKLIE